jgi:hypothetical protein
MWHVWGEHRVWVGKTEGKRPLARRRRRWKDNMRIVLTQTGWQDVYWVRVAHDRDKRPAVVKSVTNFWIPQNAGNFLVP